MNKNLQLSLELKWFEMTKSGEKKEEYREINDYWKARLTDQKSIWNRPQSQWKFKNFEYNIMTWGYPKKDNLERIVRLEHLGISIGYGNPEWGAEPNKLYFIIKHGKILL